ncbi:MAG: aminotransferase class IV [Pseudomonadota bacterium]
MAQALEHAWHEGQLKPLADVHISPLDRGYLFGDGIYEVLPVYDGKPLGLDKHLARLARSCDEIRLPVGRSAEDIKAVIMAVVEANGGGDQSVYVQLTRVGLEGRDHRFPDVPQTHLFAMSSRLAPINIDAYAQGLSAIVLPDERWARCDIKSTSLLANVLAKQAASEADAAEAILERDGELIEGATSAVGCVTDGVLALPVEDARVLPSVTRALIVEVADRRGIPVETRRIEMDECRAADEIVVMSSTREIMPISDLDGVPVGDGKAGPVWRTLFAGYQELKADA